MTKLSRRGFLRALGAVAATVALPKKAKGFEPREPEVAKETALDAPPASGGAPTLSAEMSTTCSYCSYITFTESETIWEYGGPLALVVDPDACWWVALNPSEAEFA